jgi:hypothetical protein
MRSLLSWFVAVIFLCPSLLSAESIYLAKKSKKKKAQTEEPATEGEEAATAEESAEKPVKHLGVQGGLGLEMTTLKFEGAGDGESKDLSFSGLGLTAAAAYKLNLGKRFYLEPELGLHYSSVSSGSSDDVVTLRITTTTLNLGLGGMFAITDSIHLGLNLEVPLVLLSGEYEVEFGIFSDSVKLEKYSYFALAPRFVYYIVPSLSLNFEVFFGSGSYTAEDNDAQKFSTTMIRMEVGYYFL